MSFCGSRDVILWVWSCHFVSLEMPFCGARDVNLEMSFCGARDVLLEMSYCESRDVILLV